MRLLRERPLPGEARFAKLADGQVRAVTEQHRIDGLVGAHRWAGPPYRADFRGVKASGAGGRARRRWYNRRVNDLSLVTGGAGFIGSHLVQRLLANGGRGSLPANFSTRARPQPAFPPKFPRGARGVPGGTPILSGGFPAGRGGGGIYT